MKFVTLLQLLLCELHLGTCFFQFLPSLLQVPLESAPFRLNLVLMQPHIPGLFLKPLQLLDPRQVVVIAGTHGRLQVGQLGSEPLDFFLSLRKRTLQLEDDIVALLHPIKHLLLLALLLLEQ